MHGGAILAVPLLLAASAATPAGEPTVAVSAAVVAGEPAVTGATDAAELSLTSRAARFPPVRSASADFTQEREVSLVDEVLRASGTLSLQAPEAMRLVLVAPEHLTLVADGMTVTLLDASGTPLPVPPEFASFGRFARTLTELLLGSHSPERFFDERWQGPDAVTLTPRDAANPFAEIALRFSPVGPLPEEIVLRERTGDRTIIRLSAIRLNPTDGGTASR
jgi:outer membrane lipoprotein-sorting protein